MGRWACRPVSPSSSYHASLSYILKARYGPHGPSYVQAEANVLEAVSNLIRRGGLKEYTVSNVALGIQLGSGLTCLP